MHTVPQLAADIEQCVTQMEAALADSRYLDLGEISPAVDSLCERLAALPPEAASQWDDSLNALIAKLIMLQSTMKNSQQLLISEVKKMQQAQKAMHRYRTGTGE